ncbi:MAG TPA: HlyD family efflux transporter periplasmic adaptor subunit [Candidatus Acidoferrales bacterium]|jgi:HlyD family secretion protein
MDIARPDQTKKRRIKRIIIGGVIVIIVGGVTVLLSKLRPAAPTMDGSTTYASTVTRGNMLIEVHGLGTLVPEDIRWIPAQSSAKVEKILLRSGAKVEPNSIIVELSDTQLQSDASTAEFAYKVAQANYDSLKVQLSSSLMTQKSARAQVDSQYQTALTNLKKDQAMYEGGLGPKINADLDKVLVDHLAVQLKLADDGLLIADDATKAQLAASAAQIASAKGSYDLKKNQLEALHVRAGISGVVQCVCTVVGTDLTEGQQVTLGTNLARVANPARLKATVQVPETQAKDVRQLLKATVDTRNGIVKGHVTREDAAAINGTVAVDISFDEPLPPGARPDQSVDGTIEIENMTNVLFIQRPVHGEPNSTVGLFKVLNDGADAERVQVRLGRGSVSTMEILGGLKEGDVVLLNDMSNYDNVDRIQFSPKVVQVK